LKGSRVSRKSQRHLRQPFLKYDPPPCQRRPAVVPPGPNAIQTGCSPDMYQVKCDLRLAVRKATGADLPVGQTNAAIFVLWAFTVYNLSRLDLQKKMLAQYEKTTDERRRLNHRHHRGRKAA